MKFNLTVRGVRLNESPLRVGSFLLCMYYAKLYASKLTALTAASLRGASKTDHNGQQPYAVGRFCGKRDGVLREGILPFP